VIVMTVSYHTLGRVTASIGAVLWRAARRAAVALRVIHCEQVFMWELFWQGSRVPVSRAGPLAWVPSLDGSRLTGNRLPASGESGAEGGP